MHPTVKKALRIIKYFLLSLVVLLILLVILINLPIGHSIITRQVNSILKENGIPVHAGKISISLGGNIELSEIEMIEVSKDTIVYAGLIKVSFKILPLFSKQVIVNEIHIEDVVFNLVADSSGKLNLLSYFPSSSDTTDNKPESTNPWEISLTKAHLHNIKFLYSNSAKGILIQQSLYNADISFDSFSLLNKKIDIEILKLEKANGLASISTNAQDTVPEDTIPSPWTFSAKSIELTDITYNYTNPTSQLYAFSSLKHANISVEKLDLTSRELLVPQLKVEDPIFTLTPSVARTEATPTDETQLTFPAGFTWNIICNLITIKNGNLTIDKSETTETDLTGQYLPAQKLNTTISNAYLKPEGIGCIISQMSVSLNNKLFLQSGKLNVKADSSMQGKISLDLLATTGNEIHKPFSSNDTIVVAAILSGSMNTLNIEKLTAIAYSGIQLDVSGHIKELTKIPDSHCDLKFHTNSISHYQAGKLIEVFTEETEIPEFNPLLLSGSIKNSFSNPDFKINISSNSGKITAAGNYNIETSYGKVDATLTDVKLNEFSSNNDLRNMTAKISWNGKVQEITDISGEGAIEIDEIGYKDMKTHDLNIEFQVDRQLLQFKLTGTDTTLSCDIKGDFGWDQKSPHGRLEGLLNFHEGNSELLPGNCAIKSELKGSFSKISDKLESYLKLYNLTLTKDNQTAGVDSISADLNMSDTEVTSTLTGDFIHAEFNAHSSLSQFTKAFSQLELEKILALDSTGSFDGTTITRLPSFNLEAAAQYDKIFELFIPDSVFRFNKIDLSAGKSIDQQTIQANLVIDSIKYLNTGSYGAKLVLSADQKTLNGDLTIDSLKVNNVWIGLTKLKLDILPEKITGSVFISDSSDAPLYQLGAEAYKGKGNMQFRTTGTDWIINSNKWTISPAEFLTWETATNDFIANLNLLHENMIINLNGRKSDSLTMELKNVVISQLITGKVISNLPDGTVNANVVYSDNESKNIQFKLDVNELKWKDVMAGHIGANGFFNMNKSGSIESEMTAHLNDSSSLNLKISKKDSLSQQNLEASFNSIPVNFLEPFTQQYINKLGGYASGEVNVSGDNTNPVIDGQLKLNEVTLNIIPLQAWFPFLKILF